MVGRSIVERLFGKEGDVLADRTMHVAMASAMISVSGVFLISPIVADLGTALRVPGADAGQVITAYTVPLIVVIPMMGFLADRYGRKPVLMFGLVTFGVAGVAISVVSSFEAMLGLRFVQGVGHAAIVPITVTLIGDRYNAGRETTAQGLRSASIQVIGFSAPVIAGTLVLVSWRLPFLLYGSALFVAGWVWVSFTEPDGIGGPTSIRAYSAMLARSLGDPIVSLVMVTFLLRFAMTFAFFAYVSVLVTDVFGQSALASGVVVSAFSLAAFSATTQVGRLVDVIDPIFGMVVGFTLLGTGFVLLGIGTSYSMLIAGGALIGIGGGITAPVQKSLITQMAQRQIRGGVVSSAHIFQSLGQTVGPLTVGVALRFDSIGAIFAHVGLVGAICGIVAMVSAHVLQQGAASQSS